MSIFTLGLFVAFCYMSAILYRMIYDYEHVELFEILVAICIILIFGIWFK